MLQNTPSKAWFFLIPALIILPLIVYLSLFSVHLANVNSIIMLRKHYYSIANKIRVLIGIPNSAIDNYSYLRSPFRVYGVDKSDGHYIYGFVGKLEDIDLRSNRITLSCNNGIKYTFDVVMLPIQESSTIVKFVDMPSNDIELDAENLSLEKGRQFSLIWKDPRKLTEIIKKYNTDLPLNRLSQPLLIKITEYQDE